MSRLHIHLLGKFQTVVDGQVTLRFEARKVQELFCYLCVHRKNTHLREALASVLWNERSSSQSRKYLRQAVWQLQSALGSMSDASEGQLLLADPEEICINPNANFWLDVSELERAFALTQKVPGRGLSHEQAQCLKTAVQFYCGDLLEGWYQDWCLYERERLQNLYLTMLHKLIEYSEKNQEYEAGIEYSRQVLYHDRASEWSYQALMRLEFLAGDRTAALREYDRCVAVLRTELDVKPSETTLALRAQIQSGTLTHGSTPTAPSSNRSTELVLQQHLARFKQIQSALNGLASQVQEEIQAVESYLGTAL